VITIEFEEPTKRVCECCGGMTTSLTRFVYEDGNARAVYYARFGDAHADRVVQGIVSLGDWGEGSGPWDRLAFPLEIRNADRQFQVGLVDAAGSPWAGADLLGRILDRSEALAHDLVAEVFHITDHMVRDDQPLREYLEG
jgi:hypothetical protein